MGRHSFRQVRMVQKFMRAEGFFLCVHHVRFTMLDLAWLVLSGAWGGGDGFFCVWTYVFIHLYKYIRTYIHTYIHTYIYTYIHIYIYTHTHTHFC